MTNNDKRHADAPSEDVKARFREALERKKGASHPEDGAAQSGSVHGSETMGQVQRTFRRKSGAS